MLYITIKHRVSAIVHIICGGKKISIYHHQNNTMRTFTYLSLVCMLMPAFGCMKNDRDKGHLVTGRDKDFLIRASYANAAEIEAGKLAVSKALRDSIGIFGQMMMVDHGKTQSTVDSLAGIHGITTPHTPDSVHIMTAQQLALLSGRHFDSAYIKSQLSDHLQAIELYTEQINSGNNKAIKDFAAQTLTVIQMHYQMASRLAVPYK